MDPQPLQIAISDGESVSALLYLADKTNRAGTTVILGHGAGANQLHPFMRLFASGLAERGFDVLTFNFQYMEQGRRVPDPKAKLEACYLSVIEAARKHKKLKGNRVVIGGKSMGGRIASQVAALDCGGLTPLSNTASNSSRKSNPQVSSSPGDIAGLVFLGYPLHPPGKPDKLRDAHLPQITAPMLFVQGSRDAFGTPEELRATIKKHHLPATLHIVKGGDHSLKIPKALGIPQGEVYASTMDKTAAWLKAP
ncbi:MAG: alpha/beta fold hydrolase [Blastocatellia bacterium]|nr:alpha/beta fold hydrolase [Blastocatellia bacterium]